MNYAQIAAAVYQACNAFDPYLPKLSMEMANAWGRTFKKFQLTLEELVAGVDRVYEEHGSGYRPLPKDIVDAARTVRREKDEKLGPSAEYQALCESKYISYEESLARLRARTGQPALGKGWTHERRR
jgi:hypothetical protein